MYANIHPGGGVGPLVGVRFHTNLKERKNNDACETNVATTVSVYMCACMYVCVRVCVRVCEYRKHVILG
jgi:hypothetical protein